MNVISNQRYPLKTIHLELIAFRANVVYLNITRCYELFTFTIEMYAAGVECNLVMDLTVHLF